MCKGKVILIAKIALLVGMICFLFPFVLVSCSGSVVEANGIELMTATAIPEGDDENIQEDIQLEDIQFDFEDTSPNPYLIISFALGLIGFLCAFGKKKNSKLLIFSGGCSFSAAIFLLIFRSSFWRFYEIYELSGYCDDIIVKFRWGWIVSLLAFITGGCSVLLAYHFNGQEEQEILNTVKLPLPSKLGKKSITQRTDSNSIDNIFIPTIPTDFVDDTATSEPVETFNSAVIKESIMPNVAFCTEAEARSMLEQLGAIVTSEQEFSNTVTKGVVIRSSIHCGDCLSAGTPVTLYISKGIASQTTDAKKDDENDLKVRTAPQSKECLKMTFFEQMSKAIADAGQGVAQHTKKITEITKLNNTISEYEKKINQDYMMLGQAYYNKHLNDTDETEPVSPELIQEIQTMLEKVFELRENVKQLKSVVRCAKCGAEIPVTAAFCQSCGAPNEQMVSEEKFSQEVRTCPNCGATVTRDALFCTNCGTKIEENHKE